MGGYHVVTKRAGRNTGIFTLVKTAPMKTNRRAFLHAATLSTASASLVQQCVVAIPPNTTQPNNRVPKLAEQIGIVSASVNAQFAGRSNGRSFSLLELPRILRDELDLRVIDLNTSSFPDFATVDRVYLDKLREAVEDAGCVMTNLKMNQPGIDMNSADKRVRAKALAEYKRSIDIASNLGCRWARPLPGKKKPDMKIHVDSYRELCDYGADREVQLLVENFGWMQADPMSVPQLVNAIGNNVAAGVDTGNWDNNELRYRGLENAFPLAATCDFKARRLGPRGEHAEYDLRRCFDIAWACGFRGPWALEHGNRDTEKLFAELAILRDMLRQWM